MASSRAVALGGFMGVGKSTVGRALAARLGVPFVDLDEVLAERFGPIAEQFATEGEAVFRERERRLVAELCDGEERVLATGGGAWVDPDNRRRLAGSYRRVVLAAPLELLAARVLGSGRPLWDDAVRARYAERREAYSDADRTLDASRSVDELVEELVTWLSE